MKKSCAVITLFLCFFLVTSAVSAVSLEPTNVISLTDTLETKAMAETPDVNGGVIGIPKAGESKALVVCSSEAIITGPVCGMDRTANKWRSRWVEHPAYLGIA